MNGLTQVPVTGWEAALDVLSQGVLNRTTASTLMNTVSSRSHAVFTITLTQTLKDEADPDGDPQVEQILNYIIRRCPPATPPPPPPPPPLFIFFCFRQPCCLSGPPRKGRWVCAQLSRFDPSVPFFFFGAIRASRKDRLKTHTRGTTAVLPVLLLYCCTGCCWCLTGRSYSV